jgi:hypothetical protein
MTIRTIQSFGYGFSDTPAIIVAKINGITVFEGAIPTAPLTELPSGNPFDQWANNLVSLYTFDSTVGTASSFPTTIEVTNGTLLLGYYKANYSPALTIPPGPDNFVILLDELRENVTIDGIAQNYHPSGSTDLSGTWWWQVNTGSTIAFTVLIDAGAE